MSEKRLTELESKLAYQEDTLNALNDVIYQQQHRIDRLEVLLAQYRQHLDSILPEPGVVDEKPPHY